MSFIIVKKDNSKAGYSLVGISKENNNAIPASTIEEFFKNSLKEKKLSSEEVLESANYILKFLNNKNSFKEDSLNISKDFINQITYENYNLFYSNYKKKSNYSYNKETDPGKLKWTVLYETMKDKYVSVYNKRANYVIKSSSILDNDNALIVYSNQDNVIETLWKVEEGNLKLSKISYTSNSKFYSKEQKVNKIVTGTKPNFFMEDAVGFRITLGPTFSVLGEKKENGNHVDEVFYDGFGIDWLATNESPFYITGGIDWQLTDNDFLGNLGFGIGGMVPLKFNDKFMITPETKIEAVLSLSDGDALFGWFWEGGIGFVLLQGYTIDLNYRNVYLYPMRNQGKQFNYSRISVGLGYTGDY